MLAYYINIIYIRSRRDEYFKYNARSYANAFGSYRSPSSNIKMDTPWEFDRYKMRTWHVLSIPVVSV
jgi:hypothetical protein